MKNNHKLGLYVSYYLAKYNNEALEHLGYKNWNIAFSDISRKLDVNINSVKNWRDEFDPLFDHRAGWYQRPMITSRVTIAEALKNLTEHQIRGIVKDIISGDIQKNEKELQQLLNIVIDEKSKKEKGVYILRGPTGKAAEELFIKYFSETNKPIAGRLLDCRDLGTGYDFKITTDNSEYYIEVKGLSNEQGGILLTDKEWSLAQDKKESYFLCLISNLNSDPRITFIQNPAKELYPKKYLHTSIQVNWAVTSSQLTPLIEQSL